MDAILTVRLDKEIKERGQAILKDKGLTPSSAVQRLFDYIVQKGDLPFRDDPHLDSEEIEQRLAAFKRFHTLEPTHTSDEEIRAARLEERYEIDVR